MLIIQPHNTSSSASRALVDKFFCRHELSLRTRTSVSQKLLKQLHSILSTFYKDAARFIRIGKYSLPLVGNTKQQHFLIQKPSKCLVSECVVRSSRCENKHLYCQQRQINKCFHLWLFSRENWQNCSYSEYSSRFHCQNTREGVEGWRFDKNLGWKYLVIAALSL